MSGQRLVVIEPDVEVRRPILALLAREGLACETFCRCGDACEWLRHREPPSAIIVDVDHEDNGDVRALCARARGAPVIRSSANAADIPCPCGVEGGRRCRVAKPFSPPAFIMIVTTALARRGEAAARHGKSSARCGFVPDLCSGSGSSTIGAVDVHRADHRVIAVGKSPRLLVQSRAHLHRRGYRGVLYVAAEAEHLPFRDSSVRAGPGPAGRKFG